MARSRILKVAAASVCLMLFDILFLRLVVFAWLGLAVVFIVAAGRSYSHQDPWRIVVLRLCMPLTAGLLTFAAVRANQHIAREHAEQVVAAVKAFEADEGEYPARLHDLVPEYLASVPSAGCWLMLSGSFQYSTDDHTRLGWTVVPPFGRAAYHFEDARWSYID